MTADAKALVLVSPIGDFDNDILDAVEEMVQCYFGLSSGVQSIIDGIDFAWDAKRRQFHSTIVLRELSARAPDHAFKVVALTPHDLFIPTSEKA